jgi:hypothetical protein
VVTRFAASGVLRHQRRSLSRSDQDNMPWTYHQSTGALEHDGAVAGNGYSGAGKTANSGRNNRDMEAVANAGPIPAGRYLIGQARYHPTKGSTVMALSPFGHDARGRSGFLIHGDNAQHDASKGSIVLGQAQREDIASRGDNDIDVVR